MVKSSVKGKKKQRVRLQFRANLSHLIDQEAQIWS